MQWGLVTSDASRQPISLKGVTVAAKIIDFCAEVTILQQYQSTEKNPCKARVLTVIKVYLFPIDSRAAVCGFEVRVGDVLTVAEIKPKERAQQEFQQALAAGHGAQLLEQQRPDVFQMSIGNLNPNDKCTVKISYVTDLKADGDNVSFFLPTAVAPRYNPSSEADRLDGTGSLVASGLSLRLDLHMASAITSVLSETHAIKTTPQANTCCATVELAQKYTHLEKDLVVLVGTATPNTPRLCIEEDGNGGAVAMLTLVPQFELGACKCEFVFVIDRSGSMSGSKIEHARSAMQARTACSSHLAAMLITVSP